MKRLFFIIMVFLLLFNFKLFAEEGKTMREKEQLKTKAVVYDSDSFRDPFLPQIHKERPPGEGEVSPTEVKEPQIPQLNVQGMVWNTQTPQAIINNRVFKIGDKIEEAQIIDIDREGVKFLCGSKLLTIKPAMPYDKNK